MSLEGYCQSCLRSLGICFTTRIQLFLCVSMGLGKSALEISRQPAPPLPGVDPSSTAAIARVQASEESDHEEASIAQAGIQNRTARIAPGAIGKEGDPAGHVSHRPCRRRS